VRDKILTTIVLAAGLSRRMGEENKLLLPLGGATMLETTLSNILPSQSGETLVVLGHEMEEIIAALALNFKFQISNFKLPAKQDLLNLKDLVNLQPDSGTRSGSFKISPNVVNFPPLSIIAQNQSFFKILLNENFEKGMTTSIQTGVEAASADSLGFMICLSDMPFIKPLEYQFLADTFFSILDKDKQAIVQPVFEGQRGNPTIFSSFYKNDILNLTYTEGCKPIVQKHNEHLYLVEMPTDSVLRDIDFKEEYDRLK
jgi:molybdenum cofactor cytidylyltransferase